MKAPTLRSAVKTIERVGLRDPRFGGGGGGGRAGWGRDPRAVLQEITRTPKHVLGWKEEKGRLSWQEHPTRRKGRRTLKRKPQTLNPKAEALSLNTTATLVSGRLAQD